MEITHIAGKRKESIARTTIRPGSGVIRVNSMLFDNYMPRYAREWIRQVLILSEGMVDLKKLDIDVITEGGGVMGRAEAIACSLARSLVAYTKNDDLKDIIVKYDRTLIAGDHRQTEVHKPSQSSKGPRHKKQKSYR